jgi:serine/threonine-protein kinase
MTPERWQQLKALFAEAVERPADQRESYISAISREDSELADELRRLLRETEGSSGFLEHTLSLAGGILAVPPHAKALNAGRVLCERFEILRFIARGGMGEVYEAYDSALQERVALKTIRSEIASNPSVIERFQAEVARTRAITSEHVCRVYDLFTHRGDDGSEIHFLTMQLLLGESLAERLLRHPRLTPEEALPLVTSIAAGLDAAHKKQIVHGDLKSGNIMLVRKEDGQLSAIVTDFGLARRVQADRPPGDSEGKRLAYGGTPAYMAPEQVAGKSAVAASDIYSLAVVVFEVVTGKLPFEGATTEQRLTEPPPSPRFIVPELPKSWDRALLRCLDRDPGNRYPTALEFADALDAAPSRRKRVRRTRGATGLALFVILAVSLWLILRSFQTATPIAHDRSIAVLPFEELSSAPNGQYFADGFTEELTNDLTRIPDLRVVGRDSSFRFRGSHLSTSEIGHRLGVHYVLAGSIRRSDGSVRAIARLVNAAGGTELWSREFSGQQQNLLDLQNRMAQQITVAMQVKLASVASDDIALPDIGARDLYWMGRFYWRQHTDAAVRRSLDYFAKAIERDPKYALAYTGQADSYSVLAESGVLPAADALSKARASALTAVALDPKLADAYASLGQVTSLYDRDFQQAERYFRQALELNGSLVIAHQWYSYMLVKQRRFAEAMRHAQIALEIDPLSLPANINLAVQYLYAGNYDGAVLQCRKLDQLEPKLIFTRLLTATVLARRGQIDEAVRVMENVRQRAGNNGMTLRTIGEVNAIAGRTREAEEAAQDLIAQRSAGGVPASYIAIVYATLGQRDLAFDWLEKAYAEFDAFLSMMDVYPAFESLRSDPRYADLMLRLGLKGRTVSGSVRSH